MTRRVRELLLVVGLLILPALILRASVKRPESLNALDRMILRITAPIQAGLMRGCAVAVDLWGRYLALIDVKRENERLQRENVALKMELQMLNLHKDRGLRLEKLLELKDQLPAETAAARVVGVEISPQFRIVRVRLDRGGTEVKPGMPVMTENGAVGRVARTVGDFSDVMLITDPRSSIDVVLSRNGSRGMLKGGSPKDRFRSKIDYVAREDDVQVGDAVVTSGLGGIFPRDLPVGKVIAVKKLSYGLYQDVEVEPAVDFSKLREVLIVLAPPPPPDPDAGKRPTEGARGLVAPR